MSVYTHLTSADITALLANYDLGEYRAHKGISAGVENTNYFVSTDQHELVLTLFEKHSAEELPFYLNLGEHLYQHHCKVPQPFRNRAGEFLQQVKGKPAVFIERLSGTHVQASAQHALAIAEALAQIHLATASFAEKRAHSHNSAWIQQQIKPVQALLDHDERALLTRALKDIEQIPEDLPQGVIHADLFHDNALFDGDAVSGIIDWYFAGIDSYALDIAITLNDWCLDQTGKLDRQNQDNFLQAYQNHRRLSDVELAAIPHLQVQSALRFWLSRTLAAHQHGESDDHITVKDPREMKQLLLQLLNYTD